VQPHPVSYRPGSRDFGIAGLQSLVTSYIASRTCSLQTRINRSKSCSHFADFNLVEFALFFLAEYVNDSCKFRK